MYVHSDLGYIIPVVTAFASEPRKQVHRPKETKIILSCLKSLNKIIPLNPWDFNHLDLNYLLRVAAVELTDNSVNLFNIWTFVTSLLLQNAGILRHHRIISLPAILQVLLWSRLQVGNSCSFAKWPVTKVCWQSCKLSLSNYVLWWWLRVVSDGSLV